MKEIVLVWTLLWWGIDGIGLLAWASVSMTKHLKAIGLLQIILSMFGLAINNSDESAIRFLLLPTLVGLLVLFNWRGRWLSRDDTSNWEQDWKSLGEPRIWTGWVAIVMLLLLVISIASIVLFRGNLTPFQRNMLAIAIALTVAAFTTPGCYGLGAKWITRWIARLITILCYCIVLGMMMNN